MSAGVAAASTEDAGGVRGPLHGIRVIDPSRVLAGPFCGTLLADLGAEVIRVDHPTKHDEVRSWSPAKDGVSAAFGAVNHTRRGIVLDLAQPPVPFPTLALRIANRKAVNDLVGAAVAGRRRQDVLDALMAAGIPAAPVNTVAEYVSDASRLDAGVLRNVRIGEQDVALAGALFGANFLPNARSAPPRAAEHTEDVLQSLGLPADEIARLRERGIVN